MADKDKFVNIADLKAKLRYWCKSRGASKTAQESLMETIKRIPYTVKADISETLEIGSGWIPCSERMPKVYEKVLTYNDKGIIHDNFRLNLRDGSVGWSQGWGITHWQPRPEPPEKE